jgi:hypothetical protein
LADFFTTRIHYKCRPVSRGFCIVYAKKRVPALPGAD